MEKLFFIRQRFQRVGMSIFANGQAGEFKICLRIQSGDSKSWYFGDKGIGKSGAKTNA
ncbi:hypothetical protein [Rhizobium herbae]|uniref:Uncharacterized protein n=1 Tax=Rhizobium herbae TaxID=508661 RepID=A0ABS4EFS6_9HYPH|nr:hypothetical protein [Rhizobium herbae]MBP1856764.1 hypothetical protein [Rhizobium herbae]